jgi:hypothetical protein
MANVLKGLQWVVTRHFATTDEHSIKDTGARMCIIVGMIGCIAIQQIWATVTYERFLALSFCEIACQQS